jgi:translation initiation factor IF-3
VREEKVRVNRQIRVPEVRLIGADGKQIGVVPTSEALRIADEAELDLVEISPTAAPPVCKVMDFGKYRYEMRKKAHAAKKKQTVIHLKEIKLRTRTEEHDIQVKLRSIKKFLTHGDRVKVTVFFRGREITRPEFGSNMLRRIADDVKEMGAMEQPPKLEGRNMTMVLGPAQTK